MSNYNESAKSRGVLAFANNTGQIDYESIARKTLSLAEHHLNVPTKLLTLEDQADWRNHRIDVDSKQNILWKNYGRYQAFDLSPWDETIVIDADYLVTTDRLNLLFDSPSDLVLCHNNNFFYDHDSSNKLDPVWATVFFFRKTNKTKQFFDLVGRIQRNWNYYRLLFGVTQQTFRNDFAFAMAEKILFGYTTPAETRMPFGITTAEQPVTRITINKEWMVVRDNTEASVLPRQDIHVMSKQWLQSENFNQFIQQALE